MICYVLLLFYVLFATTLMEEAATAAYNPTDVFLFNCGDTYASVDNSGRKWVPEQLQITSTNPTNASFISYVFVQEESVPRVPYMTARVFRSSFTYNIPVSAGWKFLRLYFYPTRYESELDAVNSFFAVTVNGFTLLKNFSAHITAKDSYSETVVKEFVVPVLEHGNTLLNLTFTPSPRSLAFVNGIEIVSMPDRFYSKGGYDDVITNVGSTVDYKIDNLTAFETLYRLNVGGIAISDVGDSGMFRPWLPDNDFRLGENSGVTPAYGVMNNYTEKTPAYVAPEYVYATSRTMGNSKNAELNLGFNLTWLFTVDAGFSYLVRLHFCETLPEVTGPGQRVFSVFIQNQTAKLETDVVVLSGGFGLPVYLDFNIYVLTDGTKYQRPYIRLDLHPLPKVNPMYYDAILNGVEILKQSNFGGNLAGPNPDLLPSRNLTPNTRTSPTRKVNKKKSHVLVVTVLVGCSAIVLAILVIAMLLFMKKKKKRKEHSVVMLKILLKHYTYAQVKKITKSFSHVVGKGGFGTVYGGNLSNGRKVAVKVLKDSKGNVEDFINEVATMSQTSHVNIVSLLGFCYEGSKRAIVYEFLENGSLDQFISRNKSTTQDVKTLYGISLGIARGLEYLHYGCKTRIVHFDIKPHNILLDDNLCPKVADFGLAKLCEKRESIVSLIGTRGTIGYIAPEVFSGMFGRISHKSDVYSYGMLVLEMIGARNKEIVGANASNGSSSTTYFPDWIYKDLENGEQTWTLGDEITEEEKGTAKKMILVALWCIQPCPSDRPPMNRVVEMMEGSLDDLQIPPKPTMQISTGLIVESSSLYDSQEVITEI